MRTQGSLHEQVSSAVATLLVHPAQHGALGDSLQGVLRGKQEVQPTAVEEFHPSGEDTYVPCMYAQ